jgi:hypothetical protein
MMCIMLDSCFAPADAAPPPPLHVDFAAPPRSLTRALFAVDAALVVASALRLPSDRRAEPVPARCDRCHGVRQSLQRVRLEFEHGSSADHGTVAHVHEA